MHFVDRKWLAPGLPFCSLIHPGTIAKLVFRFEDDRRSVRWHLHPEGVRICLKGFVATGLDLVLVEFTFPQAGNEKFPHAGSVKPAHRVFGAVPFIEVTDDA